jgi:ribulose-phosphate 3-epimerase
MAVKIAPSILGADFGNLENQIKKVEECNVDLLHIDVMDGNFVPNIAFGPDQVKMLRDKTNLPFDVHMMVQDPDRLIGRFAEAGADIITVHQEATTHLHRSLNLIKSYGVKSGVVLCPATSLSTLKYVLDEVDIENSLDKIRALKEMIKGYPIDIQIDGGVNLETAPKIVEAGADVLVAGSFTFKGDIQKNIDDLRRVVL